MWTFLSIRSLIFIITKVSTVLSYASAPRERTYISPQQKEELEKYFCQARYPDKLEQEEMAKAVGLTTKNVVVSGDEFYSKQNDEGDEEISTTERFTTKYVEGID